MRWWVVAVAAAARALMLDVDLPDGDVVTVEYEASNSHTEMWRYAEAFVNEHDIHRFKGPLPGGCETEIYARDKCVAAAVLTSMKAHRDAVAATSTAYANVAAERADGEFAEAVGVAGEPEAAPWPVLAELLRGAVRGGGPDAVPTDLRSKAALDFGCGGGVAAAASARPASALLEATRRPKQPS